MSLFKIWRDGPSCQTRHAARATGTKKGGHRRISFKAATHLTMRNRLPIIIAHSFVSGVDLIKSECLLFDFSQWRVADAADIRTDTCSEKNLTAECFANESVVLTPTN